MKNFIITSGQTKKTVVARLQVMKSDWDLLGLNQRVGYINRMLTGYSISQTQRDALYAFVKYTDNNAAQNKLSLNCKELIRNDFHNMWEFQLIEITETYPELKEVNDEEYVHFADDAQDELAGK